MRALRITLLAISAVAGASFTAGLALSFLRPVAIESLVRESIRREVERRAGEAIPRLNGGVLSKLAVHAGAANAERVARLRQELPRRVSAVVAEMQNANCECRAFVAAATETVLTAEIVTRAGLHDRLQRLIRAKYVEVARSLLREFRIFTGANALVFWLLFVTTYVRKRAGLQLLLPAVVLCGAAVTTASLYLFGQNWLHTILFSDYVGLAYFAYLGAAVAFLGDVAFNRARVSTRIVNTAFELAGASVSAVPC